MGTPVTVTVPVVAAPGGAVLAERMPGAAWPDDGSDMGTSPCTVDGLMAATQSPALAGLVIAAFAVRRLGSSRAPGRWCVRSTPPAHSTSSQTIRAGGRSRCRLFGQYR